MAETPWTVTRLELLYYSRLHKRWQIWQEAVKGGEGTDSLPSAPGELHRFQMFSLLRTVRASLVEVSKASGFKVDNSTRKIKDFVIVQGRLRDVLENNLKFWQGYLQYIGATSRNYGIKAEGGLDIFLSQERLKKLELGPITITGEVALDLISMLPILRHWDLQGCWFRAVSEPKQERNSFVPKARNGNSWAYPFYMASIRDSPAEANCDGPVLTESPFSVELMYEDLGAFDCRSRRWNPQYQRPQDFFECCHRPKSGDELLLYQCYSFLFDNLRKMLNPEGDFFVAYPVQVLGRLNFLHIWVRRDGGGQLKELWDFWFNSSNTRKPSARESPHTSFWSRTREFLSFNLRGIAHSTFQAAWQAAMAAPPEIGVPHPKPLGYSLCECAHLLMPLDWIKWRDLTPKKGRDSVGPHDAVWSYQQYNCEHNTIKIEGVEEPWGDLPQSNKIDSSSGSLGMRWRRHEPDVKPPSRRLQVIGALKTKEYTIEFAIRPSSSPAGSRSIPKGAVQLAIEQQLALGEMFQKQEEAKRQMVENEIKSILTEHFSDKNKVLNYHKDPQRYLIDTAVATTRTENSRLSAELKLRFGDPVKLSTLVASLPGGAEFLTIVTSQSASLLASRYLEIGSVKFLDHRFPNFWNEEEYPIQIALNEVKVPTIPSAYESSILALEAIQRLICTRASEPDKLPNHSQFTAIYTPARFQYTEANHEELRAKFPIFSTFEQLGDFPFRPCCDVISLHSKPLLQLILANTLSTTSPQLYAFSVRKQELPVLCRPGFSHTRPGLHLNIFGAKYRFKTNVRWDRLIGSTKVKHLQDRLGDIGQVLIALGTKESMKIRYASGDADLLFGDIFTDAQEYVPIMCQSNEAFVGFVIETVRTFE